MFTRLIAKLFGTSPRTPIRNASRFRPRVEGLETREVPAGLTFTWTGLGTDASFYTPANWDQNAVPGLHDNVEFPGDPANTSTNDPADKNCVDMGFVEGVIPGPGPGGGGSVVSGYLNSVVIDGDYRGTVTLATEQDLVTFVLDAPNAAIRQSPGSYATPITVTGTFEWYAGKLNSGSTQSDVYLDGAEATIDPSGNTLETHSNLNLVGASVATVGGGTVLFGVDAGIVVATAALLQGPANAAPDTVKFEVTNDSKGTVLLSGTWPAAGFNSKLPLRVAGGTLSVKGGKASFDGAVTPNAGGNVSVLQTAGVILIENGSTLYAARGIRVEGGKLATKATAAATQPDANITGDLFVAGPQVEVSISDSAYNPAGVNGHKFAQLKIAGDVYWSNGTFKVFVDGATGSVAADVWAASGKFIIDKSQNTNDPKVDVQAPVNPPAGGMQAGQSRAILKGGGGITLVGTVNPVFTDPNGWEWIANAANPQTEWSAKKK